MSVPAFAASPASSAHFFSPVPPGYPRMCGPTSRRFLAVGVSTYDGAERVEALDDPRGVVGEAPHEQQLRRGVLEPLELGAVVAGEELNSSTPTTSQAVRFAASRTGRGRSASVVLS